MKYLLAHDIGTSGDKAALFSEEGRLIGSRLVEYKTYYEPGGCVEQDPDDWWRAVCEASRQMAALVDKKDIAAMSFGGQMMGCLCVDKNIVPLRRSLIWADTRSGAQADRIAEKYGRIKFYETTGHRLSSSHTITKLMWVRDNQPDIYKKTYKTLDARDYVVYKLTGVLTTDHSHASGTLAYDVRKKVWASDVIEAAGLDEAKFPKIGNGLEVAGYITRAAAEATGLAMGMPVVLGGGDGGMTRAGTGCNGLHNYGVNLGTSAVNGFVSERPVNDPLQRIVSWTTIDPNEVLICGTMQACGASIAWMRDNLCYRELAQSKAEGASRYKYINENAAASPVGANGLLFLPYLHGERAPHWNPAAKGVFLGLTMKHSAADMQRAVFEGVCLNMGLINNIIMENLGRKTPDRITISGGAANSPVVLQAMADIYDAEMATTDFSSEAGSLGAAIVAGHGIGLYPDMLMAQRIVKITKVVAPIKENVQFYRERLKVFADAYAALRDIFPRL